MEPYFRLHMAKEVSQPLSFGPIDKDIYRYKMDRAAFDQLPAFAVAYYTHEIGIEFCDFLQAPMLMLTTKYRELFELLEPRVECKGVQVYPDSEKSGLPVSVYWVPFLEPTDCLHPSSRFYDTGLVQEIVLDEAMLADKPILKARGPAEEFWFVSLCAAECILRREPLGVGLEPVKVRR